MYLIGISVSDLLQKLSRTFRASSTRPPTSNNWHKIEWENVQRKEKKKKKKRVEFFFIINFIFNAIYRCNLASSMNSNVTYWLWTAYSGLLLKIPTLPIELLAWVRLYNNMWDFKLVSIFASWSTGWFNKINILLTAAAAAFISFLSNIEKELTIHWYKTGVPESKMQLHWNQNLQLQWLWHKCIIFWILCDQLY